MKLICRELDGYKYDVRALFRYPLPKLKRILFKNKFLSLQDGVLTVEVGYAFDGPSGPTIDTKNSMRASLVHDAGYQLMREGAISRTIYRKYIDEIFRDILLEDGMNKLRVWTWYHAVRIFSKKSSFPRKQPRGKIIVIK